MVVAAISHADHPCARPTTNVSCGQYVGILNSRDTATIGIVLPSEYVQTVIVGNCPGITTLLCVYGSVPICPVTLGGIGWVPEAWLPVCAKFCDINGRTYIKSARTICRVGCVSTTY